MKYLFFLLGIGFFLFPSDVFAESSVNVNVSSDTNSSSTTTSQGSSTTDVTIEVNGEKKTFHAEGDEDINWESEDGKSSVKVTGNSGAKESGKAVSPTSTPSTLPKPTDVKDAIKKELKTTQKNILAIIVGEIQKIRVSLFESIKTSLPF